MTRAVIIGNSGSGKSSLIRCLKSNQPHLKVIEEVARDILLAYPDLDTKHKQLKMMYQQWQTENQMGNFISDRGLPDYFVYSERAGLHIPFYKNAIQHRYNFVFKLPEKEFIPDGTRVEANHQEAMEIQSEIDKTYQDSGHVIIDVPKGDVAKQYRFIMEFLPK
jgi:predicted ATPase